MPQWPAEHLDFALERWGKGQAASLIAKEANIRFSTRYTRNSVIGQMYRHAPDAAKRKGRISRAQMKVRRGTRPKMPRFGPKREPSAPVLPLPPRSVTDIARVSFDDMQPHLHCRWPVGEIEAGKFDTAKPHYCGDKPIPGKPYCHPHLQRSTGTPVIMPEPTNVVPFAPVEPREMVS